MSSLATEIAASFARRGSAPAVLFDSPWYSFADLDLRARRCAAELTARGLTPGERVAVGLPNSIGLIESVLGVLYAGGVLIPLNPAYTPDELAYVVTDSQARFSIVSEHHQSLLAQAVPSVLSLPTRSEAPASEPAPRSEAPASELAPRSEAPASEPAPRSEAPASELAPRSEAPASELAPRSEAPASERQRDRSEDDAALIVYTSGTTGPPKGAVLSHGALLSNLLTVAKAWGWTDSDRLLLTLPCFHLHGLGLGLLTSFLVGSSVILRARFVVEEVLEDLQRHRATMFFGVPTIYNRLVSLPESSIAATDLTAMRLWVSGSAPLNPVTFERFRDRFGFALMDRYGMTECCFALSTELNAVRRPGLVGRPLPGVEVRLVDQARADAGEIVDVTGDDSGEILIAGPGLFDGYWNQPAATARAVLRQGDRRYLRSGDIATRDSDDQFRIIGRSSVDIIKTRGFKVGAGEIEAVIQRHPAVQEVAVVGLPDADQGERIVAVITPLPGQEIEAKAIQDFARQHLAPHKVPSRIEFMDEIPRTGPGKFKKKDLIAKLIG